MFKPFLIKWSFLFKLRLFLGLILFILILAFLYFKIVPFGRITYDLSWPRGLASGQGFISDFKPAARIDVSYPDVLKILAEPVYFSVFTPRTFDRATITFRYVDRLGTDTPIIEAGVLTDKISGSYELRPIQNNILDSFRFTWPRLADSDSRLILQADNYYASPSDFDQDLKQGQLKDCPAGPATCVALYNYDLPLTYRLPVYESLQPLTINQPLRGPHQFYVYLRGDWRLDFNFVLLRQDPAADPITVQLFAGTQLIAAKTLPDDNRPLDDRQALSSKALTLSGSALSSGVYKALIKISDDVVISKIVSSSDRLAFINHLWPVSGPGNLTLFTDASDLRAATLNPASLQTISFGDRTLALTKTYEQFDSGIIGVQATRAIKLSRDDVSLADDGVFAFSRQSLFDPAITKVDRYFSPGDNIKYIIADYQQPLADDGVKTATASFDLRGANRENGKYTFLISVPGLTGSDAANSYLELKEIKVELSGKGLGAEIITKIKSWFKK